MIGMFRAGESDVLFVSLMRYSRFTRRCSAMRRQSGILSASIEDKVLFNNSGQQLAESG